MTLREIVYIFSSIFLLVSLIYMSITLPSIVREGNVKNGLRGFRQIFLISGIAVYCLTFTAFGVVVSGLFVPIEEFRQFGFASILLFSVALLVITLATHRMYTFNFTPQNKKLHAAIQELEEGNIEIVKITRKKGK